MLSKFRINRAALFLGVLSLLTLPREVWGQKRVFAKVEPNADALNSSAEVYNAATGGFSNTPGSLATAREAETANLLPNGMVLLAGGFNGGYLGTAELFDPSTGAFRAPAGAMVTARSSHRAVLLQNGKVLVAGGFNGNFLSAAELYDYSTQVFTSTGAMTAARESFSATVLASGKALIAGGFNGSYLQSAEIYDTVAGTFAATGSMMTAREGHSATLLPGGKVLIAGGFNGSYLNTAELRSRNRKLHGDGLHGRRAQRAQRDSAGEWKGSHRRRIRWRQSRHRGDLRPRNRQILERRGNVNFPPWPQRDPAAEW